MAVHKDVDTVRAEAAERKKWANKRRKAVKNGNAADAVKFEQKRAELRKKHGVDERQHAQKHGHGLFHRGGHHGSDTNTDATPRGGYDDDSDLSTEKGGGDTHHHHHHPKNRKVWAAVAIILGLGVVGLITAAIVLYFKNNGGTKGQQDSTWSGADGSTQTWYKARRDLDGQGQGQPEGGVEGLVHELERRLIAVAFRA